MFGREYRTYIASRRRREADIVIRWHNKMLALPGAKKALEVQASLQK